MKAKYLTLTLLAALCMVSCSEDNPLEGEQYIKQVYIVGANKVVSAIDVPYGDTPQQTYISIATGGSQNVDHDVQVTLTTSDDMIAWYNNKYMLDAPLKYEKLDPALCNIPSMSTVIKAGDVYARLPFSIGTDGLDPDRLYALTWKIQSVSDYVAQPKDTVLIMNLNLTNEWSGKYQMTATRYAVDASGMESAPSSINMLRTLKAMNKNDVRFFGISTEPSPTGNFTHDEYMQKIADNAVLLSRRADGKFDVTGWKNLDVKNGTAEFADSTFTFSYDYVQGGKTYRLRGKMKR